MTPEQGESKTQTEMFSNASVIAQIGSLDTTSPFSSRKHPDLGKDRDAFNKLTDALISNEALRVNNSLVSNKD